MSERVPTFCIDKRFYPAFFGGKPYTGSNWSNGSFCVRVNLTSAELESMQKTRHLYFIYMENYPEYLDSDHAFTYSELCALFGVKSF